MTGTDQRMNGKVCMVTGATSGMGEATAHALADMGAAVIVVGRDPAKGAAAVSQIGKRSNNHAIELMLADLSSQKDIRHLVQQFQGGHRRLDVLVNNAGAWIRTRQESPDGIEMTFALNHLGYFLLTNLLLDTLKASAPARIINVSSYGHALGRINFDDLQSVQEYNGLQAYRQSKLANVLFTYELARRLEGTGVTVNAVNPGLVATNFGFNNLSFIPLPVIRLLIRLYGRIGTSAERGAETAIYLASSPGVTGVTGKYFEKRQAVQSSPASYDAVAARKLWQLSAELTGLPFGESQ